MISSNFVFSLVGDNCYKHETQLILASRTVHYFDARFGLHDERSNDRSSLASQAIRQELRLFGQRTKPANQDSRTIDFGRSRP